MYNANFYIIAYAIICYYINAIHQSVILVVNSKASLFGKINLTRWCMFGRNFSLQISGSLLLSSLSDHYTYMFLTQSPLHNTNIGRTCPEGIAEQRVDRIVLGELQVCQAILYPLTGFPPGAFCVPSTPTPLFTFTQILPVFPLPEPCTHYGVPIMQWRVKGRGDNNADKESMRLEPCEWLHSVKPGTEKSSPALPNPKASLGPTVHLSSVITCKLTHTCICSCMNTHRQKQQHKPILNLYKAYFQTDPMAHICM